MALILVVKEHEKGMQETKVRFSLPSGKKEVGLNSLSTQQHHPFIRTIVISMCVMWLHSWQLWVRKGKELKGNKWESLFMMTSSLLRFVLNPEKCVDFSFEIFNFWSVLSSLPRDLIISYLTTPLSRSFFLLLFRSVLVEWIEPGCRFDRLFSFPNLFFISNGKGNKNEQVPYPMEVELEYRMKWKWMEMDITRSVGTERTVA